MGIVVKVEDGIIYTVEGNVGGVCKEMRYVVEDNGSLVMVY